MLPRLVIAGVASGVGKTSRSSRASMGLYDRKSPATTLQGATPNGDGELYADEALLATYVHVRSASNPAAAESFVARCARAR
ncbi:MAG: hypothetical protein LC659_13330 [Myxococcales bacterium]|nr:hypothetical protein [Myxococcales bacterium]